MIIVIGGLAARCDATAVALSGPLTLPDSPPPLGLGSVSLPLNKPVLHSPMSALKRWSQPVAATLYLRGKRWSVGWNGDFVEVLLRQRRRSYGIAGSVGSR